LPQKLTCEDPALDFDLVPDQLDQKVFSISTDRGDASQINNEFPSLKASFCFFTSSRKFIGPGRNKCALRNDPASMGAVDN
jgi:hypothetical protein